MATMDASPLKFTFKAKIRVNGKEYASADEMPEKIREAYAAAIGDTPVLRSGARIANKLKAKIVFNGVEYNSPGDIPIAERRLYQDTLAALLPAPTVIATHAVAKKRRTTLLLTFLLMSAVIVAVHLWLRGYFG